MVALLALLAVQAGQPASGQTLVGTISRSGWAPTSLALHRPGGLLLVGDSNSASVFAFDARTLAARGSVAVDLLRVSDLVVDEAGDVSARRWCWRQSAASAAGEDTIEILVTVEGHHDAADTDVRRALADLEGLLAAHATPASLRSPVLSVSQPQFD